MEQKRQISFAACLHVFKIIRYKIFIFIFALEKDLKITFHVCVKVAVKQVVPTMANRKNNNKNGKHETNIDGYFFI